MKKTVDLRDVAMSYQGHVLQRSIMDGRVTCLHCPLVVTDADQVAGVMEMEPCPGTEEGRRLLAEEERQAHPLLPVITEPCVAIPETWEGTEAEAIGLAVAGAVADLVRGRDMAEQHLARALDIISSLVAAFPETSWAGSNIAKDQAVDFLQDHRPTPSSDQ